MNENEKKELLQLIIAGFKEVIGPLETDIKDMKDDIDDMKTRIDHMETDIKDTKYDVKNMQIQLSSISYDVRKIKLIVENELRPDIQILVDGHKGRVEKDYELERRINGIEEDVIILKTQVAFPGRQLIEKIK